VPRTIPFIYLWSLFHLLAHYWSADRQLQRIIQPLWLLPEKGNRTIRLELYNLCWNKKNPDWSPSWSIRVSWFPKVSKRPANYLIYHSSKSHLLLQNDEFNIKVMLKPIYKISKNAKRHAHLWTKRHRPSCASGISVQVILFVFDSLHFAKVVSYPCTKLRRLHSNVMLNTLLRSFWWPAIHFA